MLQLNLEGIVESAVSLFPSAPRKYSQSMADDGESRAEAERLLTPHQEDRNFGHKFYRVNLKPHWGFLHYHIC